MYNILINTRNTKKHNTIANLFNSGLFDLTKDTGNTSKDDVNKIEEMNKIANIVELILEFNNNDDQQGEGLKILTPSQMLSRLPIS